MARMDRHMREIWGRLGSDCRIQFQNVAFPEGLSYTLENGFGTTASSPFIKVLGMEEDASEPMAPPRGIEPRFPG